MSEFACFHCGFINEVEPEYSEDQEKKFLKIVMGMGRVSKRCREIKSSWIKELLWWDDPTKEIRKIVSEEFPELSEEIKDCGIFGIVDTLEKLTREECWNYKYICGFCHQENRFFVNKE